MKKYLSLLILPVIMYLAFSFSPVFASNDTDQSSNNDKGPLTKITFIHYKKNPAKTTGITVAKSPNSCYAFFANGAKWKTTEDYLINPANGSSLSNSFIQTAVDNGVAAWEQYGSSAIFGNSFLDPTATYSSTSLDNKNTFSFGAYPDSNVIAVTTVWGYWNGAPKTRELVEWDMLFNNSFTWGDASTNPALMDVQNIATHELGHSAGMADLYDTACNQETMYGYSGNGETSKRTLNTGDIKGISTLYR